MPHPLLPTTLTSGEGYVGEDLSLNMKMHGAEEQMSESLRKMLEMPLDKELGSFRV